MRTALLAWLLLFLAACGTDGSGSTADTAVGDTVVAGAAILPGEGVRVDGVDLPLGIDYDTLVGHLGEPSVVRDLAPLGVRFAYPARGIAGELAPTDAREIVVFHLRDGFTGATPDGVAPGSSRSDVESVYGVGTSDPFLAVTWFREEGLGIYWAGDTVDGIVVFASGSSTP